MTKSRIKTSGITIDNFHEQNEETKRIVRKKIENSDYETFKFLKLNSKRDMIKWGSISRTHPELNNGGENIVTLEDDPILGNNIINKSGGINKMTENSAQLELTLERNRKMDDMVKSVNDMKNLMKGMNNQISDINEKVINGNNIIDNTNKFTISRFKTINEKMDKICTDSKCHADELQKLTEKLNSADTEKFKTVNEKIDKICTDGKCHADELQKLTEKLDSADIEKLKTVNEKIDKICTDGKCHADELQKLTEKLDFADTEKFKRIDTELGKINKTICEGDECNINNYEKVNNRLNSLINTTTRIEQELGKKKCPNCGEKTLIENVSTTCSQCGVTGIIWDNEEYEYDGYDDTE